MDMLTWFKMAETVPEYNIIFHDDTSLTVDTWNLTKRRPVHGTFRSLARIDRKSGMARTTGKND